MSTTKQVSLEDIESQIKGTSIAKHGEEIKLMTSVSEAYIKGFEYIDAFTYTKENEVETAWLFLVTRSFHSIRCAMQLTLMGYYSQALSLLRTVTEDWLICFDCYNYPLTLQAILHETFKIPDNTLKLTYKHMAIRAGKLKVYEQDFKHQSKFIHCSSLSLAVLKDKNTNSLRVAPSYDEILF